MALEDYGFDLWEYNYDPSGDWEEGIHIDIEGNEHYISKMTDSHLLNTIKYFQEYDTSVLKREARRRGLIINNK